MFEEEWKMFGIGCFVWFAWLWDKLQDLRDHKYIRQHCKPRIIFERLESDPNFHRIRQLEREDSDNDVCRDMVSTGNWDG